MSSELETPGAVSADAIPTGDAAVALAFCRKLKKMLAAGGECSRTAEVPEVSVVVPVFNEEENLEVLYGRLCGVLPAATESFEIVFVDDGSGDRGPEILKSLVAGDERVVVVRLSRNFGHQIAISAGMDHARGRAVVVMDSDLQDPPEFVPELIAKWREGYEVVYAIRASRQESRLMCWAYSAFYRVLHRLANVSVPVDAGDFCIMDRKVVDVMRRLPERVRFVRGMRSWVGLRQVGLPCGRHARHAGKPKYTVGRLFLLAFDGLVSLSHTPLRVASFLGGIVSLISILLAVYLMIQRLTVGLNPPGYASLIVSILFLAGVQLLTIGVVGEYVGRIFDEVKQRPLYVVRDVVRGEGRSD